MVKFTLSFIVILVALLVFGCSAPRPKFIRFLPNTDPPCAGAYELDIDRSPGKILGVALPCRQNNDVNVLVYTHLITKEDIRRGWITIPQLYFEKEGYIPYKFPGSDRFDISKIYVDEYYVWNEDKIFLEKDPAYKGSTIKPNTIILEVNSEPRGARIYIDGRLFCESTPCAVTYTLEPQHYDSGKVISTPLIAAKEGCLPKEYKLTFIIDPEWRYMQGETFEEGTVFLLKSDPNYTPPPQPVVGQEQQGTQRQHITIKQEESCRDPMRKGVQIMSIGQTLRPIRKD